MKYHEINKPDYFFVQGSKEYMNEIIDVMEKNGAESGLINSLRTGVRRKSIRYIHVKQPFTETHGLDELVVKEFKIF